jgi:hypothetical protein
MSVRSQSGVTFGQHNFLILSSVPTGQGALLGKALKDAGSLPAGAYECEIEGISGAAKVEVNLRTSALGTAFAPSVRTLFLDGTTDETTAGVNLVNATNQEITVTLDPGLSRVKVTFTVVDSVTFDRAEYNAL